MAGSGRCGDAAEYGVCEQVYFSGEDRWVDDCREDGEDHGFLALFGDEECSRKPVMG